MKERPILFSGPMVRAILEGRKTQTRRVCKVKDVSGVSFADYSKEGFEAVVRNHCPYGKPGDRLWVRETWAVVSLREILSGRLTSQTVYRAGPHPFNKKTPHMWTEGVDKWKPSIHMFRWASRINLEIVSIRVERVQDISEADAQAEGIQLKSTPSGSGLVSIGEKFSPFQYVPPRQKDETMQDVIRRAYKPRPHFAALWDSINAKRGYAWKDNPWVWVVEFKVI